MSEDSQAPEVRPEVLDYYARAPEESRVETGISRLEFARTKEIFSRFLPKPPARVLDVGGGSGPYSLWLAELGYEAHLVEPVPRLVEEARRRSGQAVRPIASIMIGDARRLFPEDGTMDAVLLMGPLYHLPEQAERVEALREAHRVLRPGGRLCAAAISRYASALDGLSRRLSLDPEFAKIRDRDLADGQHRNETGELDYFTTAYFHLPQELRAEVESVGFANVRVVGVEGPGWILPDFEERWSDARLRADLLLVARALEGAESIVGASAHLLAIGERATGPSSSERTDAAWRAT